MASAILVRAQQYRAVAEADDENYYLHVRQERGVIEDIVHLLKPVFAANIRCEAAAALCALATSSVRREVRGYFCSRRHPKPPTLLSDAAKSSQGRFMLETLVSMLDDDNTSSAAVRTLRHMSGCDEEIDTVIRVSLLAEPDRVRVLVGMLEQDFKTHSMNEEASGLLWGVLHHPGRPGLNMDRDGSFRAKQASVDRRQLRDSLMLAGGVRAILGILRAVLTWSRKEPPPAAAFAAGVLSSLTWNSRFDETHAVVDARAQVTDEGGIPLLVDLICGIDGGAARLAESALRTRPAPP